MRGVHLPGCSRWVRPLRRTVSAARARVLDGTTSSRHDARTHGPLSVSPSRPALPSCAAGDGHVPEGPRELTGVEAPTGLGPVPGRELEVPLAGPVQHHPDDLSEVILGVEPVELARGHQREEVRGGPGVVVAVEEEPRLASSGDIPFIPPQPSPKLSRSTTPGIRWFGSRFGRCTRAPSWRGGRDLRVARRLPPRGAGVDARWVRVFDARDGC